MNLAKIAMASSLALATAAPVYAQPYGSPYRPTDDYQRAERNYEYQQDQYERSREQYLDRRDHWRAQRAEYERRRADWEAQRAAYDARWGAGAYARRYPAPAWDETRHIVIVTPAAPSTTTYGRDTSHEYRQARADYDRRAAEWESARASYDARYGWGAYARRHPRPVWDESRWASAAAPSAGYYGSNTAYTAPADCGHGGAVAGGLIGALAGGVLGSNMAHNDRTAGTVLGALVGGGVGAAVGNARDRHKCDERGAYYSYSDTVPYSVPSGYHEDRYAEYRRMGCRLAPAAVNDDEYRYVRVCPDSDGRYRVTS